MVVGSIPAPLKRTGAGQSMIVGDLDELLAEGLAREDAVECGGGVLEPFDDVGRLDS